MNAKCSKVYHDVDNELNKLLMKRMCKARTGRRVWQGVGIRPKCRAKRAATEGSIMKGRKSRARYISNCIRSFENSPNQAEWDQDNRHICQTQLSRDGYSTESCALTIVPRPPVARRSWQ